MAALSTKTRKAMPKKEFAMPKSKGFPIEDKKHARLAISGATRSENVGNISEGEADKIKAKARAKLGDSKKSAPSESVKPKAAPKEKSVKQSSAQGGWDQHDSMKGLDHDGSMHTSKNR